MKARPHSGDSSVISLTSQMRSSKSVASH